MTVLATIPGGLVQLTGNPVYINCTGGSTPSGAYEYMITLRIISEDTKLEGAPFQVARTPVAGAVSFDISGILDQPYPVSVQYPVVDKYIEYPFRPFNIQIQPGERYIDSAGLLVENWFAVSDVFQMLKGGLSPRQIVMMNALGKTFYSTYISGKKFLTPRPQSDCVHPTQPVKLWFMSAEDLSTYFNIQVFYSDGTNAIVSSSIDLKTDSLFELNCNPALHGRPFEPSSTVKILYFDVWLGPSDTFYSDRRRFEVDWITCERPYYMFFANSLGGIDDVYFSGFGIDSFIVNTSIAYRPVQPTDTVFTPTIVAPNKTGQNKWKINTGWKAITILQFYRDLMVSKQAWFLYPGLSGLTYNIIPVIIQNTDTELINRQDDQWNIDIEFIEAHVSRFSFDNRLY